MSKYRFKPSERFSVFITHGEKCYLCNTPMDFLSMQVDHIIPESLLGNVDNLNTVLTEFGLDADFEINSFENWMPSCGPCNRKKTNTVFKPVPIIHAQLQKAKKKADEARKFEEETITGNNLSKALAIIMIAKESGELPKEFAEAIKSVSEHVFPERNQGLESTPLKFTPLYEVLSEANGVMIIKGPYGRGYGQAGIMSILVLTVQIAVLLQHGVEPDV